MKIMAALMVVFSLGCFDSFSEGDPCVDDTPKCLDSTTLGWCGGGTFHVTGCDSRGRCCPDPVADYCATSCYP
jgi:hypothetical protein